jgi:hypothetical protein
LFHFMIMSHLLLILHKEIPEKMPEIWQKVAKFKGAEYFRKALYSHQHIVCIRWGG